MITMWTASRRLQPATITAIGNADGEFADRANLPDRSSSASTHGGSVALDVSRAEATFPGRSPDFPSPELRSADGSWLVGRSSFRSGGHSFAHRALRKIAASLLYAIFMQLAYPMAGSAESGACRQPLYGSG